VIVVGTPDIGWGLAIGLGLANGLRPGIDDWLGSTRVLLTNHKGGLDIWWLLVLCQWEKFSLAAIGGTPPTVKKISLVAIGTVGACWLGGGGDGLYKPFKEYGGCSRTPPPTWTWHEAPISRGFT
jgi:hypothetical protein